MAASFDYSIAEVVRLCGLEMVGNPSRKGEQKVKCPFVAGKTFDVNVQTSTFKCWHDCTGCPGGGKGGVLALYRMCHENCDSNSAAAKAIHKELYGDIKKGTVAYNKRKAEVLQPEEIVQRADYADPDIIDKTYRKMLHALTLKEEHKQNLLMRGISEEGIKNGMFKSIPETAKEAMRLCGYLKCSGFDCKGVPGFYEKKGKTFMSLPGFFNSDNEYLYGSGFFIPSFDEKGRIFSMQIRMDKKYLAQFPQKRAKSMRYLWFSSSGHDTGCGAINSASFGVKDGTLRCEGNPVYITEGALKAQVAHDIDEKHRQFVSISGVCNYSAFEALVKSLKAQGCPMIIDAFDMDRNTNRNVAGSIEKLHKIAEENGMPMQEFEWDEKYKGIDDYLLHKRTDRIQRRILQQMIMNSAI